MAVIIESIVKSAVEHPTGFSAIHPIAAEICGFSRLPLSVWRIYTKMLRFAIRRDSKLNPLGATQHGDF